MLGGEVAGIGEVLVDTIQQEVHGRVRMFPVQRVRIETFMLKDKAALSGGLALAMARVGKPSGHAVAESI